MHKTRSEYISFFVLFAAVAALLFFVLAPFFSSLALAAVAAALLYSPYEALSKFLRGSRTFAALLVVLAVLIFFIVPVFYFGSQIFHETANLYMSGTNGTTYTHDISLAIERPIEHFYPAFVFNINAYIGSLLSFVAANLGGFVSGAIFILFQTFLMLLAFFFFLRDGKMFVEGLVQVSPFGKEQTYDVLHTMYKTIQSVIKGTFLVALIRWLCVGVAFYALGVPNALCGVRLAALSAQSPVSARLLYLFQRSHIYICRVR